jgi:nicotinate-nucleotide adenylyltransferase
VSVTFGVFGGSFDPPHVAHTLLAAYALAAHPIEHVIVVPTFAHAFGKALSAFDDRVHMCELAFGDLRRVEVSSIERELPVPSLTVRTLEALAQRHAGVQLRLLIGSDLLPETNAWHDFARIAELAPPLVVQRQGHAIQLDEPALPDVSSTEIRRRLRAGESTTGLLCPAVDSYARARDLYARG